MFAVLLGLAAVADAQLPERYHCAACAAHDTYGTAQVCARLNSCSLSSSVCDACRWETAPPPPPPVSPISLRVAKAYGTKPYGMLRVSAVTASTTPPPFAADYSHQFVYRWTENALHSSMVAVTPGTRQNFSFAGGVTASLWLPAQGAGVAGVLVADPCVHGSKVGCTFGTKFNTTKRLMPLLNAFVSHDDVDFWGILGDNFYDQQGKLTHALYAQLELATLGKISVMVPGNHDYYVLGKYDVSSKADQFGNGFMQWYAQDTRAARHVMPGNTSSPIFDFSIDPSSVSSGGPNPDEP